MFLGGVCGHVTDLFLNVFDFKAVMLLTMLSLSVLRLL